MTKGSTLQEAFNRTSYPLGGHGKRNVAVLMEAFRSLSEETDSDIYGSGAIIEDFQAEVAQYLGKEAAVFFPSGTMAQQIALRIWSDQRGLQTVAYHPLCHLEIHEQDGLKELHRLKPILLADRTRTIRLADVEELGEDIACLLLELPQREIGGQLPPFSELEAIAAYCRSKGIKLHLDGARLFEILPYYGKTAAEVCALFDSVYVSFYKGIGGIAGAILAGEQPFTEASKIWKRRHGGDLISLYPYIIPAKHYMKERLPFMRQYYEDAVELASFFNGCHAISTKPQIPVSNMFHVHIARSKQMLEPIFVAACEATGVGLTNNINAVDEQNSYFEISVGDRYRRVPREKLEEAFRYIGQALRNAEINE
ncbi:low specificity L-threonine aldolase [Paenibacillus sp. R14(2021)]|uniref:threonine aldolase family protein n=1 Tax=Paenibacillus sp. R14(2021) TaxID=2859228 RepID=UPI001C613A04|nr:beta-eliminating lyase-related protein [Paenibacillus sp. R14(2021)]